MLTNQRDKRSKKVAVYMEIFKEKFPHEFDTTKKVGRPRVECDPMINAVLCRLCHGLTFDVAASIFGLSKSSLNRRYNDFVNKGYFEIVKNEIVKKNAVSPTSGL